MEFHPSGIIDDPDTSEPPPQPNPWPEIFGDIQNPSRPPSPQLPAPGRRRRRGKSTVAKKVAQFKASHQTADKTQRLRKKKRSGNDLAPTLSHPLFHRATVASTSSLATEFTRQIPAWCGKPIYQHVLSDEPQNPVNITPAVSLLDPDCNDFVRHLVTQEGYDYIVNDIQ